ncbi:hypothetical protein BJ912DRAFT_5342 [Pholiota molesta]|nr:hypothetical protein BJ912DRAFT_5342 [Pholiota molesta]
MTDNRLSGQWGGADAAGARGGLLLCTDGPCVGEMFVIVTVGSDGTFPLDRPLSLHVMPAATPAHLNDEDFINKSLLASLDDHTDTEPAFHDHDIHDDDNPTARFPHPRHLQRPAPDDPHDPHDPHPSFQSLHAADTMFSLHQGLYSSAAPHGQHEYPAEYAHHPHHPPQAQQPQGAPNKLNGFPTGPNYSASFTSYPNTTRSRQQAGQSGISVPPSYREPVPTFYPSQDPFTGQMTSPVMQQYGSYEYAPQSQQQHQHHQQHPLRQQQQQPVNGVHKSPYLVDQYSVSSKPSTQQQQQQQAPGQGQLYPFSNGIGVQLSSQTPYGPHVPAGASLGGPSVVNPNSNNNNNSMPSGLAPSVSLGMANNNGPTTTASGEEISTIFVVGFPEDMQEREFQNMFTFSPGFEGAGRGYGAANDPYNMVTVNPGGVVVDPGRDGMASWPAPSQGEDLSHYAMGGMGMNALNPLNTLNSLSSLNSLNPLSSLSSQAQAAQNALNPSLTLALPPRKQIIGFAKFRSREEALIARDVLQGRRVDIEKGAVLKAEMAKKNLHTKRGVGLVGV